MSKDATLKVRLTPSELDGLRQHAEAEATTLSALVRAGVGAVVHRKPLFTVTDLDALEALREEVRRVGVNLNTLLRQVHLEQHGIAEDGPRLEEYKALQAELRTVFSRLEDATKELPLAQGS